MVTCTESLQGTAPCAWLKLVRQYAYFEYSTLKHAKPVSYALYSCNGWKTKFGTKALVVNGLRNRTLFTIIKSHKDSTGSL